MLLSCPRKGHAGDRGNKAHRHNEDHGERQRHALILCGEHQEHEGDREQERKDRGVAGAHLLESKCGPLETEAGGQRLGGKLLHDLDGLALRVAGGRSAVELGDGVEIIARHAVGSGDVVHGGERAERHGVPA
jgi:hypothetical protein